MSCTSHSFSTIKRPQNISKLNVIRDECTRPWTAARCHRLLRPLFSRIELLKKDSSLPSGLHDRVTESCVVSNLQFFALKRGAEADGACWEPIKKRVRKTYAVRRKPRGNRDSYPSHRPWTAPQPKYEGPQFSLLPGEVSVTTPILSRSRYILTVTSNKALVPDSISIDAKTSRRPLSRYITKDGETHFQLAENMRRISKAVTPSRFKIYEGIYNALEALLKITMAYDGQADASAIDNTCQSQNQVSSDSINSRSRSLFSTCLRSIPNHIKILEAWATTDAENKGISLAFDTRNIPAETYSHLEAYGTSSSGWKHLKVVVRAHGVQAIADAIAGGLLDVDFASVLVTLCVHASAQDEAESLLASTLIAFRYPNPHLPWNHIGDNPAFLPLSSLFNFFRYTDRANFCHRQFEKLFADGILPITWLATKDFGNLWTSLFRTLSINPGDRDATRFMNTVLPMICAAPTLRNGNHGNEVVEQREMLPKLETTFASVLTTLLAMGMLNISQTRNVIHLLRSILVDCQQKLPQLSNKQVAIIAIANLILGTEPDENAGSSIKIIEVLMRHARNSTTCQFIKEDIPAFICAVARCCGRGSLGDGFEHLRIVIERLESFASTDDGEGSVFLRQIIVDSAFAFTHSLQDQKHLEYAQRIGLKFQSSFTPTKASSSIRGRMFKESVRWEEGIEEWVSVTPKFGRKSRNIRAVTLDYESDYQTPLRYPVKRQKIGAVFLSESMCHSNRDFSSGWISDLVTASPDIGKDLECPSQKNHQKSDLSVRLLDQPVILSGPLDTKDFKRPVGRLSRLGRGLLCSNQGWRTFDEDDKGKNAHARYSSDDRQTILDGEPHLARPSHSTQRVTKRKFINRLSASPNQLFEQSEDELCI